MTDELRHILDTDFDNTSDQNRYKVQTEQFEFLKKLQNYQSQDLFSDMEQICIIHCLRYKHYSDMHKEPLNNLISKYSKLV